MVLTEMMVDHQGDLVLSFNGRCGIQADPDFTSPPPQSRMTLVGVRRRTFPRRDAIIMLRR